MTEAGKPQTIRLSRSLRVLTPSQIVQIDQCLEELEEFGRITLIKRKGKLRFIEKTQSVEALHPKT